MSRFDQIYRSVLLTKFFTKGWGNPDNLRRIFEFRKIISNRDTCIKLVPKDYPIYIDKDEDQKECRILEGHFKSPFVEQVPGIMPEESEIARFQVILPKKWKSELKPVCIHLAGTGDHYFWRRRTALARPLLKEAGIASIILENPYYGVRKPKKQLRSSLHNVSDLFVMGGALVLESIALLHWCKRQGYGPLGITGISMGGHMASLAATNWPDPLSTVPCLSWTTASSIYTQGVMSGAIPWKLLEEQYFSNNVYEDELTKYLVSPEQLRKQKNFVLGQEFAKHFPESINEMEELQLQTSNGQLQDALKQSTIETMGQDANFTEANIDNGTFYHTLPSESKPKFELKGSGFATRMKNLNILKNNNNKKVKIQEDALEFMIGIMDECTHLGNFSVPVDPSLIIIMQAEKDAYVPTDKVLSLQEIWPGSEVRYVSSGHIAAVLFQSQSFRKAIIDAFDRQIKKYYS